VNTLDTYRRQSSLRSRRASGYLPGWEEEAALFIKSIRVEEGFLNGLELQFVRGLNVLIGARGTGKTSVIEAIRFGLGVSAATLEASRRATEHARSILRSGQVTLSLHKPSGAITATRAGDDEGPRSDGPLPKPIIFAQSEIEQVGQTPAGRLAIIDDFIDERNTFGAEERSLTSKIRSATAELASVQREFAKLRTSVDEIAAVSRALSEAEIAAAELTKSTAGAAAKTRRLDVISTQLAELSVRDAFLGRALEVVQYWTNSVGGASLVSPQLETWSKVEADPLADFRARFNEAEDHVAKAEAIFDQLRKEIMQRRSSLVEQRVPLEDAARKIRTEIEALKEGAGQAARRVTQLKERLAQLKMLESLAADRATKIGLLQKNRGLLFDALEDLREQRFAARQGVAATLNGRLKPRIKVKITRAADTSVYERTLTAAMRGSGLKYGDLAPHLAAKMSPRELLEAVENNDFELVADVASLGKDRAARLVAHLRDSDLADLAVVHLEDEAELYLLDGGDFKSLEQLSTGQRCTVVLPIILEHRDRILVLDQPEDHIDNAFIVETVIKALEKRDGDGQIIISTHNANIPVLGNAERVIHLVSDGRVGYVKHAGKLDEKSTIDAITGLMEGGIEAFRRRGIVYDKF
jgi:predicted ATPase